MTTTTKPLRRNVYNPFTGVPEYRQLDSVRRDAVRYGSATEVRFCGLCWRMTEYEIGVRKQRIYKRDQKAKHVFREVRPTPAMRAVATRRADDFKARYVAVLAGAEGPYGLSHLAALPTVQELGGDTSPERVRRYIYQAELQLQMARADPVDTKKNRRKKANKARQTRPKRADALTAPGLKGMERNIKEEAMVNFSTQHCSHHNPRRSLSARRLYQRDRRIQADFEDAFCELASQNAHLFRWWHLGDHAQLRKLAYDHAHRSRTTIELIREQERQGVTGRAEIARRLGISRQAVYAAINAGSSKRKPRRVNRSGMMTLTMELRL